MTFRQYDQVLVSDNLTLGAIEDKCLQIANGPGHREGRLLPKTKPLREIKQPRGLIAYVKLLPRLKRQRSPSHDDSTTRE